MAVLEDPRTSDWVYDDLHDLAKALRKGPDFPSPPPASKPLTDEQEFVLFKKWFLALYGKEADIHSDLNALGRWNAWKYRAAHAKGDA
jgi:hypothetical protein